MHMYLLPAARKESIQNENSKIRSVQKAEADTMALCITANMYAC